MKKQINNLDIFYQEFGRGKNTILLLHGWGQSHAFWQNVISRFSKEYHLFVLDLPGFGLSQEPPGIWSIKEYAGFVHEFVSTLHISAPIIIGHSFGGRIATVYAAEYPIKKLVLYSNGGLPQRSIKIFFFKNFITQWGKYLFPNLLYRLHTILFKPKVYKNNIIIERKRSRRVLDIYTQPFPNLQKYLEKITVPTLIIAGKSDCFVSPHMGRRLHEVIEGSQLVEVPNATHFVHLEYPEIFYSEIVRFLSQK